MAIANESKNELMEGGSLFLWGGIWKYNHRHFLRACLAIEEKHLSLRWKNLITWKKKRAYGKEDDYLFTREELAWFVYGDKPRVFNIPLLDEERGYAGYNKKYPAKSKYKRRTNVWTDVTEVLRDKVHEAEKPVRLYEIIYKTHSNPGETVLDICAGSGAAGVAAQRTGRKAILVEKNEKDFYKICNRMEKNE